MAEVDFVCRQWAREHCGRPGDDRKRGYHHELLRLEVYCAARPTECSSRAAEGGRWPPLFDNFARTNSPRSQSRRLTCESAVLTALVPPRSPSRRLTHESGMLKALVPNDCRAEDSNSSRACLRDLFTEITRGHNRVACAMMDETFGQIGFSPVKLPRAAPPQPRLADDSRVRRASSRPRSPTIAEPKTHA